jgi:hypothetical protein
MSVNNSLHCFLCARDNAGHVFLTRRVLGERLLSRAAAPEGRTTIHNCKTVAEAGQTLHSPLA